MAQDKARYTEAMKRGLVFNQQQRWKESLGAFRAAIGEFPKDAQAYAGLGDACFGLKMVDKALDCFKLAARYSGGNVEYLRRVADIQERMGRLSDAGRTYMAVGEVYLRRRQLDDAVSYWQLATRLEPGLLGTHKRLAMVFQRQNKTREAVREYLAIARILQQRGANNKAVQMAKAAMRLDPDNPDVLQAIELIRHGAEAFDVKPEPEVAATAVAEPDEDDVSGMVRQMASAFEAERKQKIKQKKRADDPVSVARRRAQDALAEEIFREEEDDETVGPGELSKLERDALIGQAMDFESRGQVDDAIGCYEKAIHGGLKLPAVHFMLGLLYLNKKNLAQARTAFERAVLDGAYIPAIKMAVSSQLK